jgi:hypothetical protein
MYGKTIRHPDNEDNKNRENNESRYNRRIQQ